MENENKKGGKVMRKALFILPIVIAVALVAGVVFWIASGRMSVVFKNPNQIIILRENVCGPDQVNQYNELLGSQSINVEELSNFTQQLYDEHTDSSDPNCLFMIAQGSALTGNAEQSTSVLERLTVIEETEGVYASGSINTLTSIRDLTGAVNASDIEPTAEGSW
jgi:hypothetical protein